jgi:hypothetical protein
MMDGDVVVGSSGGCESDRVHHFVSYQSLLVLLGGIVSSCIGGGSLAGSRALVAIIYFHVCDDVSSFMARNHKYCQAIFLG